MTDQYRHTKTGGLYELVCSAKMEKTGEDVIVYRNVDGQAAWVRPAAEFLDGRFVLIKSPTPERKVEEIRERLRAKAQEIRDYLAKFTIYGFIGTSHLEASRPDIALCDEAADLLTAAEKRAEDAERERDELSADLAKLRDATHIRPSKKAVASLHELLETMEAMDEEDAPALRVLMEMNDKLGAL